MTKTLFIVMSTALLANCKIEDIVVIPDVFPVEKILTYETYQITEVIDPVQYVVVNDCLFLMGMQSEPIFQQYKLPELTYVKSFGTRGRGPKEYISPWMSVSPNLQTLYIKNLSEFNTYRITHNGELAYQGDIKLPSNVLYNQFHIINDSLLIYNMGPDNMGIEKVNLQTKESNRILLDDNYDGEYFRNAERGIVAANDKHIVYAYTYRKQMDIYNIDDMSLEVRLRAKGRQYASQPIERNSPHYYRDVCLTERYIYALYVNPDTDDDDNKRYVEVFDYEGTPLKRYNMGKHFGVPYAVSPDDSTIYSYHSQFDDKIQKFDL
jgi:hypothetical protein